MKTTKIILLSALTIVLSVPAVFAQTYEWEKAPKEGEKELELVLDTLDAGSYTWWGWPDMADENKQIDYSTEQVYKHLFEKVKNQYKNQYPDFAIRNFKWKEAIRERDCSAGPYIPGVEGYKSEYYSIYSSAIIVIPETAKPTENPLSKAIDKAMMEVREGSRIAIDQIRVTSGINKEDYKDEVVEILLDKGFKVVAKEYMERLYEEQQSQQSGIYNEKTTVKENNLSAVGYYLNVKLTETSLRVQVVNVSTGEYEGNVTIKLQE